MKVRYPGQCTICGSQLNADETCPLCAAQAELDAAIGFADILAGEIPMTPIEAFPAGVYGGKPLVTARESSTFCRPPHARQYIAFDIEIAKTLPDNSELWDLHRPFGISCAATADAAGNATLWYGRSPSGGYAEKMSRNEVIQLVHYLRTEHASGKTILSWNGASFDFQVLAEESGLGEICAALALDHIDMMFHLFCLKGFGLALDKAAKGMGLPGKLEEVGGAKAPEMWRAGQNEIVLEYVKQDVITTMQVCQAVEAAGELRWLSQRGNRLVVPFPSGWLSVLDAQCLPLPDTSWMDDPWRRSRFTGWMDRWLQLRDVA